MEHYALRKHQGPGVWAHVRADYIAGEPAGVVARRYDVSVANLRKRASHGGWTRAAYAQAGDAAPPACAPAPGPPAAAGGPAAAPVGNVPELAPGPPPGVSEVLDAALARAAACLQAGRADEALRAVELGERLAALAASAARLRPKTLDEARAANAELREAIEEVAQAAAIAALTDPETAPEPLRPWARAWWAEHGGGDANLGSEGIKLSAVVF